jgi:hypothetical protein
MNRAQKLSLIFIVVMLVSSLSGCLSAYKKSVGGDSEHVYTKVLLAEYPIAWESAVDALKTSSMDIVNRENGTLQTKWIDNTAERNLIDAAGSVSPYTKAQYRFRVTLAKGFYDGKTSVKVSVQKEQEIERDVLEGYINQESDGIQENSLIYRISKIIQTKLKMQDIENARLKRQLKEATQNSGAPATN